MYMWYIYGVCVCVCVQNRILLSLKRKNKILPFTTTWMDLEGIMFSEIKSDKDKYCMLSLICRI